MDHKYTCPRCRQESDTEPAFLEVSYRLSSGNAMVRSMMCQACNEQLKLWLGAYSVTETSAVAPMPSKERDR